MEVVYAGWCLVGFVQLVTTARARLRNSTKPGSTNDTASESVRNETQNLSKQDSPSVENTTTSDKATAPKDPVSASGLDVMNSSNNNHHDQRSRVIEPTASGANAARTDKESKCIVS